MKWDSGSPASQIMMNQMNMNSRVMPRLGWMKISPTGMAK